MNARYDSAKTLEILNLDLEYAKQKLAKWAATVNDTPGYAFTWSDDAFKAAGTIEANTRLISYIEHPDCGLEGENGAIRYALHEVVRGAASPASSTSKASNLTQESIVAAYAEFLQRCAR